MSRPTLRHSFASLRVPLLVLAAGIPLALGIAQPPAAPPSTPEKSPEELIKDLEKKQPPAPAAPATPTPIVDTTTITDSATTGTRLLREGTFITSRRGRMTRSSASEWIFSFDADARGAGARADPAMVILPCMNLQNMERVVERSGDGVTFTLSGQVFVYKSRNYLLPTMYVVNRRADIAPAQ